MLTLYTVYGLQPQHIIATIKISSDIATFLFIYKCSKIVIYTIILVKNTIVKHIFVNFTNIYYMIEVKFKERLKEQRKLNHLLQRELAQKLNVPTYTICDWEKGRG